MQKEIERTPNGTKSMADQMPRSRFFLVIQVGRSLNQANRIYIICIYTFRNYFYEKLKLLH